MSWFDGFGDVLSSLFSSNSASAADALMGGTVDLGQDVASNAGSWAPDLGQFAFDSAGDAAQGFDWGSLANGASESIGHSIAGANPAMFTPGGAPPSLEGSGYEPNGGATLGSVAPNQGGSVVGQSFGGGDTMTGAGSEGTDPEAFARQGADKITSGPVQTGSGQVNPAPPPPTAWESLKQAPGKWWQGATEFPGKMAESFNKDPFGNSVKLGLGAAQFGLPLAAAAMAPGVPKPQSFPQVAPKPLPGTTGTSAADIPAGPSMNPLLGKQGGFQVGKNKGFATGGLVQGLQHGGMVNPNDWQSSGGGLSDAEKRARASGDKGSSSPEERERESKYNPKNRSKSDRVRD